MNKKTLCLGILSVLLISILAAGVSAGSIKNKLTEWFGTEGVINYLFNMLPNTPIGAKILFILLIFTVLFGSSQFVLKHYAQNIRIAMSLIIAIISGAAMPATIITKISTIWGGIFYVLFIGVPVIGGFYLIFTRFKEPTRGNYVMKAALAGMIAFVCFGLVPPSSTITTSAKATNTTSAPPILSATIADLPTGAAAVGIEPAIDAFSKLFDGFTTILEFLGTIALLMTVYYFFKILFPGGGPAEEGEGLTEAAKRIREAKGAFKDIASVFSSEKRLESRVLADLEDALRAANANDQAGTTNALNEAKNLDREVRKLGNIAARIGDKIERMGDAAAKAAKTRQLNDQIRDMTREAGHVQRFIGNAEGLIRGGTAVNHANVKRKITNARNHARNVVAAIGRLEALERRLAR